MKDIIVKDIMVTKVVTVYVEDPLSLVEEKMRVHNVGHIPIVDGMNKPVGIITHRDFLRRITPRLTDDGYYFDKAQIDQFILKHVMTKDPVTLKPTDPLISAVEIMIRNKYGCIPVVEENGKLAGIIAPIDVLKLCHAWLYSEHEKDEEQKKKSDKKSNA